MENLQENKFYDACSNALTKVTKDLLTKYPSVKTYTVTHSSIMKDSIELHFDNGILRFSLDFHYDGDNSFYIVKPNGGDMNGKLLDANHNQIN